MKEVKEKTTVVRKRCIALQALDETSSILYIRSVKKNKIKTL